MQKETMQEMNEKYKNFPVKTTEYEIDGRKYIVHSHFVGNKEINEVISRLAFQKAMQETFREF